MFCLEVSASPDGRQPPASKTMCWDQPVAVDSSGNTGLMGPASAGGLENCFTQQQNDYRRADVQGHKIIENNQITLMTEKGNGITKFCEVNS